MARFATSPELVQFDTGTRVLSAQPTSASLTGRVNYPTFMSLFFPGTIEQLIVSLLVLVAVPLLSAQTFRGGLNGSVSDASGALVPDAQVELVEVGTGAKFKAVTSSGGEFTFLDLSVGKYDVNVRASRFKPEQVKGVQISAGTIYTLPVKIGVVAAGETVEVAADALTLDTTSTVATTDIPNEVVQNTPMNGRDFTQMIAMAPGYAGYSGGGFGSVNGSRPDMINWQIEGADNNDIWWNLLAANQSGVYGIAPVTLPLDAIEQISTVTQAGPDIGRSPGATVNLSIKSGTNQLHGSAYYYNRNKALAVQSRLQTTKPELRNQQFGYSAGGPIWKDHLFFFTTYEDQRFTSAWRCSTSLAASILLRPEMVIALILITERIQLRAPSAQQLAPTTVLPASELESRTTRNSP